jgi:MFS family permease
MSSWSGVYLRGTLGLPALGGGGVAAFFAAMALGRLAAGLAVARLGNRRALLEAGLMMVLGMSLALSTTVPALTVVGFLVVGLGVCAGSRPGRGPRRGDRTQGGARRRGPLRALRAGDLRPLHEMRVGGPHRAPRAE